MGFALGPSVKFTSKVDTNDLEGFCVDRNYVCGALARYLNDQFTNTVNQTIDFINTDLPPGARAAVELSLESAKALQAALTKAIAEAEEEEAERAAAIAQLRLAKAQAA